MEAKSFRLQQGLTTTGFGKVVSNTPQLFSLEIILPQQPLLSLRQDQDLNF